MAVMQPHTRAMIAASAHAVLVGRKVAGLYDHAAGLHRRIAAESRDGRLQGVDGDRSTIFGGALPDLYDDGDKAYITMEVDGMSARGYDRGSGSFYSAEVSDRVVQIFDHAEQAWFAYDVQTA